jgi:hypothetical protein
MTYEQVTDEASAKRYGVAFLADIQDVPQTAVHEWLNQAILWDQPVSGW